MTTDTNREILQAFRIAIETELQGLQAYLSFARKTKDETGKNMFIVLANDELQHYRILERAMVGMQVEGGLAGIEVSPSVIQRITPTLRNRDSRLKGEAGADQVNALTTALDQERRSMELYRQQYAKATDPKARELFNKLAEMEEAHYDIIQAELDNIQRTGFWFKIPEFDLED